MALRDFFLPYQLKWLADPSPRRLAVKSRQIGWTWVSSFEVVSRSLEFPGLQTWYFTRDLDLGKEFLNYCRPWWRSVNRIAEGLWAEPDWIDPRSDVGVQKLEFPNGSKLMVLSSNPDAARGKSGDARIDELSSHQDQEGEYAAVEPITTWGGTLSIYSTHKGNCLFKRLVDDAQDANPMGWSLHKVTIVDAVRDGLVKKVNERRHKRGLPALTDDEFLAEKRRQVVSDAAWQQEYMCEPSQEAYTLFPWDLIRSCEQPWEQIRRGSSERQGPAYIGFDVGRHRDLSVIWILERVEGLLWTREVVTLEHCPFDVQRGRLEALMNAWRPQKLCIDATTIGIDMAEWAVQRWGEFTCIPVKVMQWQKHEMFSHMLNMMRSHQVWLPDDDAIRRDIHGVDKMVTPGGNIKYVAAATPDGHADRAFALALALAAAGQDPGRLMAARVRKEQEQRQPQLAGWSGGRGKRGY